MIKNKEWLLQEITKLDLQILSGNDEVLVSIEEVGKLIKQMSEVEKPVIPDYVADFIEGSQKEADHWFEAWDELYCDYKTTNEIAVKEVLDWVNNNPDKYVDAYRYGYTMEKKKAYRFTLNAFHEVDILSYSKEGAFKQAEQEWQDTFGGLNTFGGPEFEGEVTE